MIQSPIACETRAHRFFGRLNALQFSAWPWVWSWDSPRFMRRHPPHRLSPARANHPAGQDPEARLNRSTSPQQRSDQDGKPVISERETCSDATVPQPYRHEHDQYITNYQDTRDPRII